MASDSVNGFNDLMEVDVPGWLGLVRANDPIAAHPLNRMHRVPSGVVLAI